LPRALGALAMTEYFFVFFHLNIGKGKYILLNNM
jgi:hypothetical protein